MTILRAASAHPADDALLRSWPRRERSRRIAAWVLLALGAVSVLSALSLHSRVHFDVVLDVLPFEVTRSATPALVFVGVAQLLVARGLRRGQRLAWAGALALLALSALLHLAKAAEARESLLSLAGLVWLASQHRSFPVLPARRTLVRAVVLALVASAGAMALSTALVTLLGRHHHLHLGSSALGVAQVLTGQAALPMPGVGPLVRPALGALGVVIMVAVLWVLLSPRIARAQPPDEHLAERERARAVVAAHGGGSLDYFALRDDKRWFFHGASVVAFAVHHGACLVSPDPIGPVGERAEVWAAFTDHAQRQGWSVSVVAACAQWLPVYERSGLRTIYLGDEAVVDCSTLTLEGRAMKSLRSAHARVVRSGYAVSFHDPAALEPGLRGALEAVVGDSRRGEAERGFSMTLSRLFDPADTGLMLTVARAEDGSVGGFIQWVPSRAAGGWSLDVMRRSTADGIPNGVTDFLVVETARHLREHGGGGLALNFAVLRTLVSGEAVGRGARLGRSLVARVGADTQMESLWRYNAKFAPSWHPRYVVVDSLELALTQGLALAEVEGVTEIPLVGRLARAGA